MVRPRRSAVPRDRNRFRQRLAVVCVLGLTALPLTAIGSAQAASAATPALVTDPASLVNPLIGTSGAVDTFPGPDIAVGMVQWGPDTTPNRPDGGGYEYNDTKLSGFSLTHVSGPGCPVMRRPADPAGDRSAVGRPRQYVRRFQPRRRAGRRSGATRSPTRTASRPS